MKKRLCFLGMILPSACGLIALFTNNVLIMYYPAIDDNIINSERTSHQFL